MELDEFVAATLLEIQRGVQKAISRADTEKLRGAINPQWGERGEGSAEVQRVAFDIAVTVVERSSGNAGGGIKVVGLQLGAAGSKGSESSQVSRIQFSVPLIPPTTTILPLAGAGTTSDYDPIR